MKNLFAIGCIGTWLIIAGFAFVGCTTLQTGADPLVVRAEQLETTADASFQLVVSVDNADRGFWKTNAPAFHNFAEWLRAPVTVEGNTNEPRGLGFILLVDSAKLQYQANHSLSNNLEIAISDLSLAASQAQSWATIVTTTAH